MFPNHNSYITDDSCTISSNSQIYYPNHILAQSVIHDSVHILPYNYISHSTIMSHSTILHSTIMDSFISHNVRIGPFAHIRQNSHISNNCRIGNFCEIKNSRVGQFTKISHHSYVGDSTIGEYCNIGCGVIFANYDGIAKHHIHIGDNVFVGCNTVLIAPLNIASHTYICANSTVTQDTQTGDLVIGRVDAIHKANRGKGRYVPS